MTRTPSGVSVALEVARDVVQLGQRAALGERDEQLDVAQLALELVGDPLLQLLEPFAGDRADQRRRRRGGTRARGGARRRAGRPC